MAGGSFYPLEALMAAGSVDRKSKLWPAFPSPADSNGGGKGRMKTTSPGRCWAFLEGASDGRKLAS